MSNFSYHLKKLAGFIDCECVYKESGTILHVQVKEISIQGKLILIKLLQIESVGFSSWIIGEFSVSSMIEYLDFGKNILGCSIVNFELFTGMEDVKRLVEFAKGSPDLNSFIKAINEVRLLNQPKRRN